MNKKDFMFQIKKPFLPNEDYKIVQGFGENPEVYMRFGMPAHNGLDFACPLDTAIVACQDGEVVNSEFHVSYGNIVKLKHSNTYFTLCAHLSKCLVKVGEKVQQGQTIGLSGSTGFSTGPHLHFGLQSAKEGTKPYNYYIDPIPFFSSKVTIKDDSNIKLANNELKINDKFSSLEEKSTSKQQIKTIPKTEKYIFNNDLDFGINSPEVTELQKRLKQEGFFDHPNFSEYFGPVTKQALINYQIAKGIIKSPYDQGAGRVGPGTRKKLNE